MESTPGHPEIAPPAAPPIAARPIAARPHPPTSPGPVEPDEDRRTWPTAIGVLLIVLQSIGFLVTLATAASLFIDFSSAMRVFGAAPAMDAQRAWRTELLATYAASALLSILAIAGAALLLYRRRLGVTMLLAWALLRLPHALFSSWVAANAQRDTMKSMPQTMARPTPAGLADVMYWTTFFTSMLWLLILPAFVLIWFLVPPIRRQTRLWP